MHLQDLRAQSFKLPGLRQTLSTFELKINPHHKAAEEQACTKFDSYHLYTDDKREKYFGHDIAQLCAWVYPETRTQAHLESCIALLLWLLAYDDLADESGHKKNIEGIKLGGDISRQVLENPHGPAPTFKFARMLQDIFRTMKATGSEGACSRFSKAFDFYVQAAVRQTSHRVDEHTPTVEEFVELRRSAGGVRLTIGKCMLLVCFSPLIYVPAAFIEYAMELNISDDVHNDAKMMSLIDAAVDIICWTNDICSFNKEQSHGDNQNLVYCAFVEKNCTLQEAIDFIGNMVVTRVEEFLLLRDDVKGSAVPDVVIFLKGLEHWISGSLHWSYNTNRYFSYPPVEDGQVIRLYQRKEDPDPLSVEHVENFSASTHVEHVEH
ncbi:isoprenoid synthase domain-containing protein [Mycena rosella]|uniref:Terpene synthase n=1 Tax=Mycena rosella TaxID=1033263 RepID=A0AAD7DEE8_MYCRO|nr:isoprenoid synthase domain-containing protein [Mycena rosella]